MRNAVIFALLMLPVFLFAEDKKPESKSFTFTVSFDIAEDAKIILDLPVFDVGPKSKTLTKEEFRKNAKEIIGRGYRPKTLEINEKGKFTLLHFVLPIPPPAEEEKQDDFLKVSK
jgi:hypothetical protein